MRAGGVPDDNDLGSSSVSRQVNREIFPDAAASIPGFFPGETVTLRSRTCVRTTNRIGRARPSQHNTSPAIMTFHNRLLRSLTLTGLLALLAGTASAQYTGSDDFNGSSIGASWDFQYSLDAGIGTWTETNNRLEFTSPAGSNSRVLVWNNDINNAYNENWTASLTVSNLTSLPAAGYNLIGLQVFAANNADLGFFGLYATNNSSTGANILFEKALGPSYTMTTYGESPAETDLSDVLFTMSFNAATKDVTLAYSLDSGATIKDSVVFNPGSDWSGAPTDGFSFRILGYSTADAVAAGQLYADNFSVTAVPEPSTYAAIAGALMLGFAMWRRRRAATA
jgi:hypothetical protein